MLKNLAIILLTAGMFTQVAYGQEKKPAPSPLGKVHQVSCYEDK